MLQLDLCWGLIGGFLLPVLILGQFQLIGVCSTFLNFVRYESAKFPELKGNKEMKVLKSIGFKDCLNYQFPQLVDPHYISGWLEALRMMYAYNNILHFTFYILNSKF
jgi:hypothetical protein